MASYFVYTDASFSKKDLVGIIGILIFNNTNDHTMGNINSATVHTIKIQEKNNIRVEFRSVICALNMIKGTKCLSDEIFIYTDCRSITNLLSRRKNLEESNYISNRKKQELSNTDLYKEFFILYDSIKPNIVWVKGHSAKSTQDTLQRNFSYIDKLVRKELRDLVL